MSISKNLLLGLPHIVVVVRFVTNPHRVFAMLELGAFRLRRPTWMLNLSETKGLKTCPERPCVFDLPGVSR